MRPLIVLFLVFAISTDYIAEGARCKKSSIGWWTCSPCGRGSRCHFCIWCTGYCYKGHSQTKRSTGGIEYGSVEAQYKVPFLDMFNDMNALLNVDEISDPTVVDLYKEASDDIKKDCTLSNNSADLNNLSIFTEQVYVDLESLVGTELFKPKAIEKTEDDKLS